MKNDSNFFSEWLEKLQQESWQLELLISGFAIYGLFESRPHLFNFARQFFNSSGSDATLIGTFLAPIIIIGWYVFIVNLVIHVLLRGLWIGAIGLRYVSGDIDYEQLRYNDRFTRFYQRKVGSFDTYIERLERISSVIFSYTFLLFFIFLSLLLYFASIVVFSIAVTRISGYANISPRAVGFSFGNTLFGRIASVFLLLQFLLGLLVVFDFLTLGILKRIKQPFFAAVYYWIFRFYALITLSFLWRPLLLNFLDQKFTRKLFLLAVPYAILVAVILPSTQLLSDNFYPDFERQEDRFYSEINKHSYNYRFYDDERAKHDTGYEHVDMYVCSMPSKVVRGRTLEIFFKSHAEDAYLIAAYDTTLYPLMHSGIRTPFHDKTFIPDAESERLKQHRTAMQSSDMDRTAKDDAQRAFAQNESRIFEENLQGIKRALRHTMIVRIDRQVVPDSLLYCDFYIHANDGEKGLLCFTPIDHLRVGRHTIDVDRAIADHNGSETQIDTLRLSIPFYYEGDD